MKKVLGSVVILTLTISMLAGCGKKEVDYSLTDGTEAGTESNVSEGINDDSLEQFRNQDAWVEDVEVTNQFDRELTIEINAEIVVPELTGMRVIQSKSLAEDEEFKIQCLENFFGTDAEYYYHEEEHYTKDEIASWFPDDYDRPGLNEAPDERTVAEEFESVSHYAALRNEVLYEITLTDRLVTIEPNWNEVQKCGPEIFRDYKTCDIAHIEMEGQNECKYSMEEAEQIADDYIKDVGLSSLECISKTPLVWWASNAEVFDENANEYASYGYVFEYITGSDGVSFDEFPEPWDYITSYRVGMNETIDIQRLVPQDMPDYNPEEINTTGESSARIIVTDNGVEKVVITNAATIEETSNSVGLLPLDTIKGILRDEVRERHAKYNLNQKYNELSLIYLRSAPARDQHESDTHIPVWCLSYVSGVDVNYYQRTNYNPIFVNAIDGTIIHYADAEWANEEIPEADLRNTY